MDCFILHLISMFYIIERLRFIVLMYFSEQKNPNKFRKGKVRNIMQIHQTLTLIGLLQRQLQHYLFKGYAVTL